PDGLECCAHEGTFPGERYGYAKSVISRPLGHGQLLLEAPHRPRAGEDVSRALASDRADIVVRCADQGTVLEEGDGSAKIVARRPVGRGQLLLEAPRRARASEDIRRALARIFPDVIFWHAGQGAVLKEGHGHAKRVAGRAAGRGHLLLEAPRRARADEDVHRALVDIAANAISRRADQGGVPGNGYGTAKTPICGAVVGV